MIIIEDINKLGVSSLVATIGFFDGVHVGHRFLIEELKAEAKKRNLPSAVITFPQHPRVVLHADYQPKLLNSLDEKLHQLATTGIDYCILLPFTEALAKLSAQAFIQEILSEQLHVSTLLIGYDHRFGHNRTDGFDEYVAYGVSVGLEVKQAKVFTGDTLHASSSEIRRLLLAGNITSANRLLSYAYTLKGKVVTGHKVGRTIGFPTANISIDEPFKITPPTGVYAVHVRLDNHLYGGMLYIGNRPTLNNGMQITTEVHIFDFTADIYEKEITVYFEQFVRGDKKFADIESLKAQLVIDKQIVEEILLSKQL